MSESKQKQKLLPQQKPLISDHLSRQGWCLPKDQFLFSKTPQELLDKTSTVHLGNWILTRKPAILKSERLTAAQAIANTNPVHHWFKPLVQRKFQKTKQWCQDKLLFDPFNKKKGTNNPTIHTSSNNSALHQALLLLATIKMIVIPLHLTLVVPSIEAAVALQLWFDSICLDQEAKIRYLCIYFNN